MSVINISKDKVNEYLEALLKWDAFEIEQVIMLDGSKDVLIPYVMNDAAEYFLRLKNCKVQGKWNEDDKLLEFSIVEGGKKFGLILRQPDSNTVTIWYESALKEEHCYQYHRIGHEWRTKKGEEHWRRLVNILCVLHDKYTYLGSVGCNELELELYPLIEFAPICFFTPINQSIEDWYPETYNGITAIKKLALDAEDNEYLELLKKYEAETNGRKRLKLSARLSKELLMKKHERIFWLLEERIKEASLIWEPRDYGKAENSRMEKVRKKYEAEYRKIGYEGEYPILMAEDNSKIYFVEEHPFTVMEASEYEFKVHVIDLNFK